MIFLGQCMLHDAFNQLADTNARFVVWGAHMPGQRYRSIGSDNLLGGRRATLHLARLGRKAILFLGGSDPEALQRRRGYLDALGECGLEADPKLITPVEFELEFGRGRGRAAAQARSRVRRDRRGERPDRARRDPGAAPGRALRPGRRVGGRL